MIFIAHNPCWFIFTSCQWIKSSFVGHKHAVGVLHMQCLQLLIMIFIAHNPCWFMFTSCQCTYWIKLSFVGQGTKVTTEDLPLLSPSSRSKRCHVLLQSNNPDGSPLPWLQSTFLYSQWLRTGPSRGKWMPAPTNLLHSNTRGVELHSKTRGVLDINFNMVALMIGWQHEVDQVTIVMLLVQYSFVKLVPNLNWALVIMSNERCHTWKCWRDRRGVCLVYMCDELPVAGSFGNN